MAGLAQLAALLGQGGGMGAGMGFGMGTQPGAAAPQMPQMGTGMPGMGQAGVGGPGPVEAGVYQGENEPLTEEEFALWKKRITRSHRKRRELRLTERWTVLNEYYEGRYYASMGKENQIAVNWMFANVRSALASLYYENPQFFVTGLSENGRKAAPVIEQVLTLEREVMEADEAEEWALLHGLKFGFAVLKHGYSSSPTPDLALRDIGAAGDGYEYEPRGAYTDNDFRMEYGHPWKIAVKPWNFGFDPDAKHHRDARWFWHRYPRPYVDVREDMRFDEMARADLQPSGKASTYDSQDGSELDDLTRQSVEEDCAMVWLYEIFDRVRNRVIVFADNGKRALLNKKYDHFGRMTPYEFLVFYDAEEHPYGISWSETFRSQVEVINDVRTQMLQHLNTWGRTLVAYMKGRGVNEEDIKRFLKSKGLAAIGFDGSGTEKITDLLDIFPRIELNPDSWRLVDQYHRDMVDISGTSELGRQTTETATEAMQLDQKQGLRIGHMRKRWDKFLQSSARRDVRSLRYYWGPERVIPLLGPDGQIWEMARVPHWLVNSEWELRMTPGSTERVDDAVRKRQIIDAVAQITPLAQAVIAQGYTINWVELLKEYLRKTEIFRNPERLLIAMAPAQGMGMGTQPGAAAPQMGMGQAGMGAPGAVNLMGGMPWAQGAGVSGRTLSEMFGGGAFGGGMV